MPLSFSRRATEAASARTLLKVKSSAMMARQPSVPNLICVGMRISGRRWRRSRVYGGYACAVITRGSVGPVVLLPPAEQPPDTRYESWLGVAHLLVHLHVARQVDDDKRRIVAPFALFDL